ncbi:MAG: tRNA lysidine(34) synthetase TilS [Mycoplasmataceae bacterium]|nr:tRNA lysidine(34) synthetase TilS [Mycoplasmataceae bacterium]
MKLIAISGGVDSMLLAYKYRNKDVVLAFVNYNVRNDTNVDQQIVEEFSKKYNIKLEKLILDGFYPKTNFENWAREIRYDFFQKIYFKYNCTQVLIAHHKDDYLETCIMQKERNINKYFFGIKQRTTFKKMKIYRPFLFKYWKNEIYQLANKFNIKYNEDYTNMDNSFKRNSIRNEILSNFSNDKKQSILENFYQINKENQKKIEQIKTEYKNWRISNFSIKEFKNLENKEEIIKIFLNKRIEKLNLNKNILKNIIQFIESSNNKKKFMLNNNNFLIKKNNKLLTKK